MDKTTALASVAIPPHLQPHARRIREAGGLTLNAARKLGQELRDAREAAQHGEWLPFLAALGIPETSARRYMKLAVRLAERPDAEREPLTTMRAVLEGPTVAGPDGERQIVHMADLPSPAEADAALERELWEIEGEMYQTHPWLAAIPEMDRTVFGRLVDSIREMGQIDPVVVHRGTRTLLDGRARIQACAVVGVPVRWDALPDGISPAAAVWSYNMFQPHLSEEEWVEVQAKLRVLRSRWAPKTGH